MRRNRGFFIILFVLINQILFAQASDQDVKNEKVKIIPRKQSHSFMFTNSIGLFYYGETGLPNTSSFHGLSFLTHEFLEDYIIEISGTNLKRSQAEVHLYADKLKRFYNNPRLEEEISIADSLPILTVKISAKQKAPLSVTPLISGSRRSQDYIKNWSSTDKILYIQRKIHLVRNNDSKNPIWIGVATYPSAE